MPEKIPIITGDQNSITPKPGIKKEPEPSLQGNEGKVPIIPSPDDKIQVQPSPTAPEESLITSVDQTKLIDLASPQQPEDPSSFRSLLSRSIPFASPDIGREMIRGAEISLNQIVEFATQQYREISEIGKKEIEEGRAAPESGAFLAGLTMLPEGIRAKLPKFERTEAERAAGVTSAEQTIEASERFEAELREKIESEIGVPPESFVHGLVRNVTRATIYTPVVAAIARSGVGPRASTMLGGILTSQLTFEANEPRLANILADVDNETVKAVGEALKYDKNDPNWLNELKQAIEEGVLGVATLGAIKIGGTTLRPAARKARDIYYGTLSVRRHNEASAVGHTSSTKPLGLSFRSDITAADTEAAKLADELLSIHSRRPKTVAEAASAGNMKIRFREGLEEIQERFSQLIEGGKAKPWTSRDIEAKIAQFSKRIDEGEIPPKASAATVNRLEREAAANEKAVEEATKFSLERTANRIRRNLRENIIDRSGTVKREILEEGGREAEIAVTRFELAQGASLPAQRAYNLAYNRTFRDLSSDDLKEVSRLIKMRRVMQIKISRPNWEPPTAGRKTRSSITDWEARINKFRRRVGEEKYDQLNRVADNYFNEMLKGLDVLMEAGVISPAERIALRRFQFSPIEFLDQIDPVVAKLTIKGRPISVASSGIKKLGKGARQLMYDNPEAFMAQVLARSYQRAFRNRANQGLYNFAKMNPDNVVARIKKPKGEGDWTQISVKFGGETKKLYLRKDLEQAWLLDPVTSPTWVQNVAFSPVVRSLATGAFAPEFAPVNFFYDITLAQMAAGSGKLYSPVFPVSSVQLARDLAETAGDAFGRKGLYHTFIERGGGMSLLTHQGRLVRSELADPTKTIGPTTKALQAFETYAGYLNETSEIWTRLAVMNRVLRNIKRAKGVVSSDDLDHAVAQARGYLDFAQGGAVVKQVDGAVPYTNAAIQGFRSVGRAIKNSPVRMAIRVSQAVGVFASTWYANHIVNPEAWRAVPDHVKGANLIFTTPWYRTDRDGNRRYMYFKIPLEHSLRGLNTLTTTMLDRSAGNITAPSRDVTLKVLREGASIIPGVGNMPPSLNAVIAHSANYDWWRGDQIWRGDTTIPPTMERKVTGERPTSPLSIDVAETVNPVLESLGMESLRLSPERLDVAGRALFPRSVWTDMVGAGYRAATEGLDESITEMRSKSIQEHLVNAPFLRRFIGETHPYTRDAETLKQHQEVSSAEAAIRREEIRKQIDTFKKQGEFGPRQGRLIQQWIEQQDPIYRPGLNRYLKEQIKIEQVFKLFDPDKIQNTPSRSWWIVLSGAKPMARATAFWDEWVDAHNNIRSPDAETRKWAQQKMNMMRRLARVVPGFNPKTSKEFGGELVRLSRESGVPLP